MRELTALSETQLANSTFKVLRRDFGQNISQNLDNPTVSDNDPVQCHFVKIHMTRQTTEDDKASFTLRIIDISNSFKNEEEEEETD
mmetsp:Transcript_2843/g.4431  ORF Transcript_2843/g.4431 Transcript_2843/m.4431 type:complete len:86 (-) Transcript_2843:58-315(-)